MPKSEKAERRYDFIVQVFGDTVTKYDASSLIKTILNPESEMSLEEIENNHKPYINVLQDCYEKDPIKTSKILVRKGATLLQHAYSNFKAKVLEAGMKEDDPKIVGKLLENWKNLKTGVEMSERIIFNEHEPPSCLIDSTQPGKKELTYLQELEKHLESLKK